MELYLEFEIFFCYLEELGMEVILEKNSSPIWRSWKWSSISKKFFCYLEELGIVIFRKTIPQLFAGVRNGVIFRNIFLNNLEEMGMELYLEKMSSVIWRSWEWSYI